jgi:hypothetical protein
MGSSYKKLRFCQGGRILNVYKTIYEERHCIEADWASFVMSKRNHIIRSYKIFPSMRFLLRHQVSYNLFFNVFLGVLGFELRASHLLHTGIYTA